MKTTLEIEHLRDFKYKLQTISSIPDEEESLIKLDKFLCDFKSKYWRYVRDEDEKMNNEGEEEYFDDSDYEEEDEFDDPEFKGGIVSTDKEGVEIFSHNVFQNWKRIKQWIDYHIDENSNYDCLLLIQYIDEIENLWKTLKRDSRSDGLPFSTMPQIDQDRLEVERVEFLNELLLKFANKFNEEIIFEMNQTINSSRAIQGKIDRLKLKYNTMKKYNLDFSGYENEFYTLYTKLIRFRADAMIDKINIEIALGNDRKKENLMREGKEKYRQDIKKYGFIKDFFHPEFDELFLEILK